MTVRVDYLDNFDESEGTSSYIWGFGSKLGTIIPSKSLIPTSADYEPWQRPICRYSYSQPPYQRC